MAAHHGHVGIIKDLTKGKTLGELPTEAYSPLGQALRENRMAAAEILVQKSRDHPLLISLSDDDKQMFGSFLHLAVLQGNL